MEFLDPKKALFPFGIFHGARIADFGCGVGEFSVAAALLAGPTGKVYALDIQGNLLSRAKTSATEKGITNVEILTADLEKKGGSHLGDASCDFVIVTNTLFLVENKKVFLEEAARVLKQGGKMLLIDWSESYDGLGPPKDMVVTKEAARALLQEAGLATLSENAEGAYHYAYILSKP